ncbi:MAG: tetratricopeptide repeat protein [Acidobacteriota bacterium]
MRSVLIALTLSATLTTGLAIAQDAAAFYRQGVDLQRQGDLAGAAALYRQSLERDPSNIAARSNLGAALAGLGRYDEAIPEYQQALQTAPEQVRPYLRRNLALAWYKSGRLQEAEPLLLALHDAQPENREATLLASDCLLQLGEPAKALALLEPLAAEAAQDKGVAYVLGMAYLRAGKTADAQRVLDPLLRDETSAEGRYALGMAMFTSGDYPAALRAFRRAIQLNPQLPHIQSYYGQSLVFTGDPDGALEAFRQQLAADRNDYDANFEAGLILARRAKFTEAEPYLKQAALLRPQSTGAHLGLAEALIAQSQWPAARAELEDMVRQWPEFGAAHARLADVYAKTGLQAEASRERTLAAKFAPKTAAPAQAGLKNGALAPRFRLPKSTGDGAVDVTSPEKGKPTVLVFGSYSCPNFRKAAPALNELAQTLGRQVSFLQVYIREAHSTEQWQSTMNERENIQLAPVQSAQQKQEYATMCRRNLHLRFPAVIDGLDDAAEKAYQAWPSRVYVLSADGRIRYSSALIEEEFDRKALEQAVKSLVPRAELPARKPLGSSQGRTIY